MTVGFFRFIFFIWLGVFGTDFRLILALKFRVASSCGWRWSTLHNIPIQIRVLNGVPFALG